jgi:hypothetical protein
MRGKAHPFPRVTRQLDSALIFAAYQRVFLRYLLAPARFLDLREMGMTLLLPSLSLYASSMYSRSFLLRLKIFLELLSAQSSNWAKVKPNTSLSADFFISSAPNSTGNHFRGLYQKGAGRVWGFRTPQTASNGLPHRGIRYSPPGNA